MDVSAQTAEGGCRMQELKPCPFCGGLAILVHDDSPFGDRMLSLDYSVHCASCGAKSGQFLTEDSARKLWNRRADNG